jgi:hypothetical protein
MENIVITTEDQKLMNFFNNMICRKDMALYIRRSMYVMSKMALSSTEDTFRKEWIDDGFYYLNELAETLDPYLNKELE